MARWLLKLAMGLGAKPPPHLRILVMVDGSPVLLMNDAQARSQVYLEGGLYELKVGAVKVRLSAVGQGGAS